MANKLSVLLFCCCYFAYVSFQVEPTSDTGDGKTSRVTRNHVIIAVTCAVIVAMVITGVIVDVKFSLDNTAEIVKVIHRLNTITPAANTGWD